MSVFSSTALGGSGGYGSTGYGGNIDWGSIGGGVGALAGLGLQAFGASQSYEASKEKAEASQHIAQLEMQRDMVRQQAMHAQARRQSIEQVRQGQQRASMNLAAGVNQGAQFGSGVAAGQGNVTSETNWNIGGINQNVMFGDTMFGINSQINQQKQQIASAESKAAYGSGLSSLGGDLGKSIGPIMNLLPTLLAL